MKEKIEPLAGEIITAGEIELEFYNNTRDFLKLCSVTENTQLNGE